MNAKTVASIRERRVSGGWSVSLVALLILGACGGETSIGQQPELSWELEVDPAGIADHLIDFGETSIGATATRTVEVRNLGAATLAIEASGLAAPFGLEGEARRQVPPGGREELALTYRPGEIRSEEEQGLITLRTNESGERAQRTIRLKGRGVAPALDCEPNPLDLGEVVRGSSLQRSLSCTNTRSVPVEIRVEGIRGNHRDSFSAAFASGEDAATVEAGAAVELHLGFQANTLGSNQATLHLEDGNDQPLTQIPLRAEVVARALRLVDGACLDFGYVGVGEEALAPLRLKNIGTEPARILSFAVPAAGEPYFSIRTEAPLELQVGAEEEVEIAFHPPDAGFRTAEVELQVEDETGAAPIRACVSGYGGGPSLSCVGDRIDFGQVALGLPVTRNLRCVNDGVAPEQGTVDSLMIHGLSSSLEAYVPRIVNDDGTEGPRTKGYAIGDVFQLEVTYAPTSERVDEATIALESSKGTLEVRVLGEGVDLPPCEFSLIPRSLRFGLLDRGDSLVQEFGIRNEQETACLVHDLHLVEGSDPSFSLEPIESAMIPGWGTLRVPVRFSPGAYGDRFEGRVRFQISSERDRIQEVSLSGSSAQPCLMIRPKEVDFGKAMPGCETHEQTLTVSNVCGVSLVIDEIEVNETLGAEAFAVRQRPIFPATLQPNRNLAFTMIFSPEQVGDEQGTVAIHVQGLDQPYLASLTGEGVEDAIQTDHFEQPQRFTSDILWVIDNSTSFDPFQRLIADNLPAFLEHAKTGDFRIAVTTSGLLPEHFGWGDPCPGGAGGGEDGRFFPIDGSHPRILTPQTPNLDDHWRHNTMVGACHALEEPIEAALRALTPPLIDNTKDPRYPNSGFQDGNAGFLREEADLAIIFVTDQMDHSYYRSVPEYLRAFRQIKGLGRDNSLKFHAITIPPSWSGLPGCGYFSHERSDRIMFLVEETGGTWVNLCDATDPESWKEGMREMSQGTFGFSSRFAPRGIPGDRTGDRRVTDADIEVRVDGKVVEPIRNGATVWTYDPVGNAVDFSPLFIPSPGAEISITYRIACDAGAGG